MVVGGWPPLGGPYAGILEGARLQADNPPESARVVLRDPSQYRQWVTYFESIEGWPEVEAVARITCPRMVFTGADGDSDAGGVPLPIATTIRARQVELEELGWRVEVIPGRDFSVGLDPEAVVPVVRAFLDDAVSRAAHSESMDDRTAKGGTR